jgi:hypothetical protein
MEITGTTDGTGYDVYSGGEFDGLAFTLYVSGEKGNEFELY